MMKDIFSRTVGVQIIDANTMRLTDDYCSFLLHKSDLEPGRSNWRDAMAWAKEKGYELPDRWQGLTICRYKDEIRRHFGVVGGWYIPTKEIYNVGCIWTVRLGTGGIYYSSKHDTDIYVFGVSE